MGTRHIILSGFLILVGVTEAAAEPAPEAETSRDDEARDLFYRGEVHYAAGRYRRAASLFEEAYELSGRPELLFNMANAHERIGEYRTAAKHLRVYIASVKPKDSSAIRLRIAKLEERDAERSRLREEQVEQIVADREKKRLEGVDIDDGRAQGLSTQKKIGYVALAGGGVGVVGALVFGVASASAGRDARALCIGLEECPASAKAAQDREKRFALMTKISAGVGLASVGVGAFLLWRESREDEAPAPRAARLKPRFVPAVYEGGAGLGFGTTF